MKLFGLIFYFFLWGSSANNLSTSSTMDGISTISSSSPLIRKLTDDKTIVESDNLINVNEIKTIKKEPMKINESLSNKSKNLTKLIALRLAELWKYSENKYVNFDDFLRSIINNTIPLSKTSDLNEICFDRICHFSGHIRVAKGILWTPELNDRLSRRFEAVSSSLSDMIAVLFRDLKLKVSYLDVTRIMSPMESDISVDFEVSFLRPSRLISSTDLAKSFNDNLYSGYNLGPYTVEPEETQFFLFRNPRSNRKKDENFDYLTDKTKKIKHQPEIQTYESSEINQTTYTIFGSAMAIASLIVFIAIVLYFTRWKKRSGSAMVRDSIYLRRKRSSFRKIDSHELSFFDRIRLEDAEQSLYLSAIAEKNRDLSPSLADETIKFEEAHKSTLKSNSSGLNSSVRRKLEPIKERESIIQVESDDVQVHHHPKEEANQLLEDPDQSKEEMTEEKVLPSKKTENDSNYDVIEFA